MRTTCCRARCWVQRAVRGRRDCCLVGCTAARTGRAGSNEKGRCGPGDEVGGGGRGDVERSREGDAAGGRGGRLALLTGVPPRASGRLVAVVIHLGEGEMEREKEREKRPM